MGIYISEVDAGSVAATNGIKVQCNIIINIYMFLVCITWDRLLFTCIIINIISFTCTYLLTIIIIERGTDIGSEWNKLH